MKEVTKMSRLSCQLEKMFRIFNSELFGDALEMPVITVTPSARSYAHYTMFDAWVSKSEGKREINIASGTLSRPLEEVAASLVHEMCHQFNDMVAGVQDTSRKGCYHNKAFADCAESHGLTVTKSDTYGFAHTAPADRLLEILLDHDELREIEMYRVTDSPVPPPEFGRKSADKHSNNPPKQSHHRKYVCPNCGCSVRATKEVHLICADCAQMMTEVQR